MGGLMGGVDKAEMERIDEKAAKDLGVPRSAIGRFPTDADFGMASPQPRTYRKTALIEAEQYLGPDRIGPKDPTQGSLLLPAGVEWVRDVMDGLEVLRPTLQTLEGRHFLREKDWIITNPTGERYNCADDKFRATYEPVAP